MRNPFEILVRVINENLIFVTLKARVTLAFEPGAREIPEMANHSYTNRTDDLLCSG